MAMRLQSPAWLAGGLALLLSAVGAAGQGTFQAINFTPPGVAGYLTEGVGWSFVPTSDLLVTAVCSTAPQVTFWQGAGQAIATYGTRGRMVMFMGDQLRVSSPFLRCICPPVRLISSRHNSQTSPHSSSRSGQNSPRSALRRTSANLRVTTLLPVVNGHLPSLRPQIMSITYYSGPNFQFEVVPEPNIFALSALGALFLGWRHLRRRG